MTRDGDYERLIQRADMPHRWLADVGLDGLMMPLAQIMRPLGPLGAQVLWLVQPGLGAVDASLAQEAGVLADVLEDPLALDHLLSQVAAKAGETAGTE